MDLSGDLSKLKVVELKAELAARGLDTKGVKAVLVSRLEEALAAEKDGTTLPSPAPVSCEAPIAEVEEDVSSQTTSEPAVEPSPARPTRRRRTRSTTKSPSPEPRKIVPEPVLETLQEESEVKQDMKEETAHSEAPASMEVDGKEENSELKGEEEVKTEDEHEKGTKRSREDSQSPSRKRSKSVEPNADDFTNEEDEPEIDESKHQLSWFDSDLHLKIDQTDFLHAKPISDAGLNLVWAGARGNFGVKSGKVAYEVYLSNYNRVNHSQDDRRIHEFRCGWSTSDTTLQLGESPLSFGFESNGKKCVDSKFEEYGKRYGLFDVVGVYLDLDSSPCTIEYTVNGEGLGKAFEFEKDSLEGKALYPHISTRNIGFAVNFGQTLPTLYDSVPAKPKDNRRDRRQGRDRNRNRRNSGKKDEKDEKEETPKKEGEESQNANDTVTTDGEKSEVGDTSMEVDAAKEATEEKQENSENTETENNEKTDTNEENQENADATKEEEAAPEEKPGSKELLPEYIFIDQLTEQQMESGPQRPATRQECEVILMIGLPGSGKTYWVRNFVKEHPEKRYNVFGVQFLLEKMKINGEPRKPSTSYRWSQIVESLSRSINILSNIACKRRRNYILDQPNVYANLQRRKMSRFGDFHRKAVIVFPEEEDHKTRSAKRIEEQGKEYSVVNEEEMKSKLSLPVLEHNWFNEIIYTELQEEKARELLKKINEDGQAARKKRKNNRDDRSRQRFQKFQDGRRDQWRQSRGGGGFRPGEGYGYGRPDRFRDSWGGSSANNWMRGGDYSRRSGGFGNRFDQRRQDDRRRFDDRNKAPSGDPKRQKNPGDKNWSSNNWGNYGFSQGSGWAQNWPPQGARGSTNGNHYGGTWW